MFAGSQLSTKFWPQQGAFFTQNVSATLMSVDSFNQQPQLSTCTCDAVLVLLLSLITRTGPSFLCATTTSCPIEIKGIFYLTSE